MKSIINVHLFILFVLKKLNKTSYLCPVTCTVFQIIYRTFWHIYPRINWEFFVSVVASLVTGFNGKTSLRSLGFSLTTPVHCLSSNIQGAAGGPLWGGGWLKGSRLRVTLERLIHRLWQIQCQRLPMQTSPSCLFTPHHPSQVKWLHLPICWCHYVHSLLYPSSIKIDPGLLLWFVGFCCFFFLIPHYEVIKLI